MIVTALFHYGRSYGHPTPGDGETFSSLRACKEAFRARLDFDPYYPCTDDSASAWVFVGEEEGDYPDYVLSVGPRGAIKSERG